ncbi:MAG: phospho-sugar mutase, partial [Myxococcota bacterium]
AVRDKDGISAMLAFVELAASCAQRGETVLDRLEAIYREHGLHVTCQQSIALDPKRKGPTVGELLRQEPPTSIGGRAVQSVGDILTGKRRLADGSEKSIDLPQSDVLVFELDGGARVVVRPSGTEPKLKCYYELRDRVGESEPFEAAHRRATTSLDELVAAHQAEIAALSK